MKLARAVPYPRTLGLLAIAVIAVALVASRVPLTWDTAWIPQPVNVVPLPNPLYEDGALSGPWLGDLAYSGAHWYMGDGRGGIWRSPDGMLWQRAQLNQNGRPRTMQNAPVRSVNISATGTMIATFLGGGGLVWPGAQRLIGMRDRQRAPIARSSDGLHWQVISVPESCGIHFSATNDRGIWIAPGCKDRLLISEDDGRTWRVQATGLPPRLNAQGYMSGTWVVGAGKGADGGIYTSQDLMHWRKAMPLPAGVTPKRTLALHGRLVMTGNHRFIASSANGRDWRLRHVTPGQGAAMRAGVWHSRVGYVLAGSHGQAMYSPDLATWFCGRIGLGTKITGMAISDAGEVLASSLSAFVYRLAPWRLHLHATGHACRDKGTNAKPVSAPGLAPLPSRQSD